MGSNMNIQEKYLEVMDNATPGAIVEGQTWKRENFIQIAKGTVADLPTPAHAGEFNLGQIEELPDALFIWDFNAKQWVEFQPPEDSEGEVVQ